MKLAGLQLDRFGARAGLPLSDISDQLNVVYGPNGSGKTTVIQFIRWMMFGQRDEISRRYLSSSETPASGSMTIRDAHTLRTLRRTSQPGSMLSQLTVEGGSSVATTAPVGISNSEFDHFFVISFDQPRTVGDLLNSARSHGLQMHIDERQLARVQQLTEQINLHRSELSRFGSYGTIEVLRSHREDKRREIESIRLEWQRRREELERKRHEFGAAVSEQQMLVDRLRNVVSNIDSAVETRKRQLAEEHSQWLTARQESEERRRRRIQEIDAQIARWQGILAEVRTRLEQVRARITSFGDVGFSATEATDLHFFMRKLGFRIRDIEQDLSGVYETDTWRDHEADADYLRGLLGSALNSMQSDVTRLAQTVERQQQTNELHECREELTYLCRVEQELTDLIDAIGRQRNTLSRESEFLPNIYGANTFTPGTLLDSTTATTGTFSTPLNANPGPIQNLTSNLNPNASETIRQNLFAVSPWELATALDDFRLRHLVERRESANARLQSAELELTNHQRNLREVEEELSRFDSGGRTQTLEREIAEIDEQIRQLEMRQSLERNIASLEEELRRAREHTGRSEVIDEASAIFQRLTNDDYREIRIAGDHQCRITRADSQQYAYSQLSRGVQDQVYLAISLAIVNAYSRKGVSAPVILNDVFANLDETGTRALADVLVQFASRGNQTIVFTRHSHIRELFQNGDARLFELNDLDSSRYKKPAPYVPTTYVPPRTYVPPAPVVELPPEPADPTYQWVAEWQRRDPVHSKPHTPIVSPQPTPRRAERSNVERPRIDRTTERKIDRPVDPPESRSHRIVDAEPTLSLDSPLTRVSTLAQDLVQLLADVGIHQVGEFVETDPDLIADKLVEQGVTAEMIQRRQRELLMLVYLQVSMLDAQLLVACGVPDPARLSRADEAVLLKRVETILERPQATKRFGAFSQYSLSRIRKWIEAARTSSYQGRSRRSYTSNAPRPSRRTTERTATLPREEPPVATRPTLKMKTVTETSTRSETESLRFYLEPNDPVVDAPSIGPKTAEKLHEVDVYTVTDLLSADTNSLAAQLDDKRISADTIEQWQLQAQLVCQIPNLRGHDAQILVACGVEDPITLSSLDAGTFLKRVKKFVGTADGKRVIRNNKKPDLAEVASWIEWSESARQVRAA